MLPEVLISCSIRPALSLLPARMDTPEARALMLAIALQESGLEHRRQIARWEEGRPIYGPARGWYQFEEGGSVRGVLTHPATSGHAARCCDELGYTNRDPSEIHQAIEDNDALAGVFARLNLWWLPWELPMRSEPAAGWDQYLEAWRPSKPHPDRWAGNWAQAWQVIGSD